MAADGAVHSACEDRRCGYAPKKDPMKSELNPYSYSGIFNF